MEIPGSSAQLLILLLFVVPGSVYQAVRQRLGGPAPDDLNFSTKLFRAIGISTALMALYLAVAGRQLLRLVETRSGEAPSWNGLKQHVRILGWMALLLLLVVPAMLGILDYLRASRSFNLRKIAYDPVPRAWDFAFKDLKPCFVRVLTTDGLWLGGWFGEASYVSGFPEPREIFIEIAHELDSDGQIGRPQEQRPACTSVATTFAPLRSCDYHYHDVLNTRETSMARDRHNRPWIAPRRGGYSAVPVKPEEEAEWLAEQAEIARKAAERIPPPGRGAATKAWWAMSGARPSDRPGGQTPLRKVRRRG